MDAKRAVLTAEQVMHRQVFVLHPDDDVIAAATALHWRRVSGAPVVADGRLVGVFSERDALTAVAAAHYDGEPPGTVAQHMRRDFVVVPPGLDLYELASAFHDNPVRRLPVVDAERRLLGLVTRGEVLRGLLGQYTDRQPNQYERLQAHMALRHGE